MISNERKYSPCFELINTPVLVTSGFLLRRERERRAGVYIFYSYFNFFIKSSCTRAKDKFFFLLRLYFITYKTVFSDTFFLFHLSGFASCKTRLCAYPAGTGLFHVCRMKQLINFHACTKILRAFFKYPTFGVLERKFILLFCIPYFNFMPCEV
jgi:hypothetical protein